MKKKKPLDNVVHFEMGTYLTENYKLYYVTKNLSLDTLYFFCWSWW